MMPIALYGDREKALGIQSRLVNAGFKAALNEKPRLTNFWVFGRHKADIRVEVPSEQTDRAEAFLQDLDRSEEPLSGAIRCPECGSLRVQYPQYAEHSLLTNLAMGVLARLRAIEKDYYCTDCHFAWPKEGYCRRRNTAHAAPYYFIEGIEQTRFADAKTRAEKEESRRAA